MNKYKRYLCLIGLIILVTGCASNTVDLNSSPYSQAAAIKGQGGMYKVGKPYKIKGTTYYPKEDYHYSEVGIASWYGSDFHNKRTANGEKYDMNTLTAAHRTLPLPSIVRVTNLENGRSLVLRVNDRGPYAKNRIIDISKRGAQLLGYQMQGTAKVRVELLEKESKNLKAALLGEKIEETSYTAKNTQSFAAAPVPAGEKTLVIYNANTADKTTSSHAADNRYFVQAGSFSQQSSAANLKGKLSQFGNANIAPVDVSGQRFYRVRIGPFSFKEEADVTLAKVRNYGVSNASVVKY
ncbi:MAG: septal ring lytic transglycosylase RlpA family protein [Alphaproteobacteria bacterium]|nr:septal ring lytic transglycosylase RlpA family protein [Alphaproteobacteria bacterium]